METKATLKNLGLNDQEISIYLCLLRLGGSKASAVARELGIKRTTSYPLLKQLASKGFVNLYFRNNTRFYYAARPSKVSAIFQKKLDAFEKLIPHLEMMETAQMQTTGLRFIETLDELKEFYRGILVEYKNKEYKIISSAVGWESLDPDFFIQYRKDRGKQNIRTKLILSGESKTINPTDPILLREWRYAPSKYDFKSTIDIYDDKILVVSPHLSSLAVVIAIPAMVDVFKSVFEMLWDFLDA